MSTALAMARCLQGATAFNIRWIIRTPRPLHDVNISLMAQAITPRQELTDDARSIMADLRLPSYMCH